MDPGQHEIGEHFDGQTFGQQTGGCSEFIIERQTLGVHSFVKLQGQFDFLPQFVIFETTVDSDSLRTGIWSNEQDLT